jgi:hypothetical protein
MRRFTAYTRLDSIRLQQYLLSLATTIKPDTNSLTQFADTHCKGSETYWTP